VLELFIEMVLISEALEVHTVQCQDLQALQDQQENYQYIVRSLQVVRLLVQLQVAQQVVVEQHLLVTVEPVLMEALALIKTVMQDQQEV
jgi:ABC-type branched-subunit amino acid transport system ATPase component